MWASSSAGVATAQGRQEKETGKQSTRWRRGIVGWRQERGDERCSRRQHAWLAKVGHANGSVS